MTAMTRVALLASLLAFACSTVLAAAPARPPVEFFFQNVAMGGATLSPTGRHVIARASFKGLRSALVLIDLASMTPKVLARYASGDVNQVFWINDKRIGYTLANLDPAASATTSGMYAIDLDGKASVGLQPAVANHRSFADNEALPAPMSSGSVLAGQEGHHSNDTFVIVDWEGGGQDLALMDTRSGESRVIDQPDDSFSWLIDADGLRMTLAKEGDRHSMNLLRANGRWHRLASFAPASPEALLPRAFIGGALYVQSQGGTDRVGLYRFNLDKAALEQPALISSPDFDISGVAVTEGKRLLGYRINTDAESTVWFDQDMQALQAEVDALLPHLTNRVRRASRSETPFVLVSAYSPSDPGHTFVYHRSSKQLTKLGTALPGLERTMLSSDVNAVR